MDWHSRYVLAWRLSNTLEVDFCVAALEEALSKGRPQIFNTDQGSQFTSEALASMLLAQGVQVSMDGRGRCMDNVFVERLWRSIKYEEVYLKAYQNGTEARKGIGAYLAFYNQERPHQALGYRSPGQVFHAVSPQRCLLELPRALPSDEGLRDTPAVDSPHRCPDDGVHLTGAFLFSPHSSLVSSSVGILLGPARWLVLSPYPGTCVSLTTLWCSRWEPQRWLYVHPSLRAWCLSTRYHRWIS